MELTKTQKRQRLLTMIFGALAIFFTGYPHIWSVYQPYVMEQVDGVRLRHQYAFILRLVHLFLHWQRWFAFLFWDTN